MFAYVTISNVLEEMRVYQDQLVKIQIQYEELKIEQQKAEQQKAEIVEEQIKDLKAQTETVIEEMQSWWQDKVKADHVERKDEILFETVEVKAKTLRVKPGEKRWYQGGSVNDES